MAATEPRHSGSPVGPECLLAGLPANGGHVYLDPGARAGIELTLEAAKELRAALDRAIAAAEFEEAEVRGKGVVLSLVPAV